MNIGPATKQVKAFGTDDEVNLYTALKDESVEADRLSCFIHMKRNIERKLRDIGIKGGQVTKFTPLKFLVAMPKKEFWTLNLH